MEETTITKNAEQTRELGERIARELIQRSDLYQGRSLKRVDTTICLYGELGSGKTTFVQGLAKGLGIKQRIISPTFVLIREYKLKTQNSKFLYHIDLYRVESQEDLEGLGIEEIINNPQNIVAIEWAEKLGNLMPEKRIDIAFQHLDNDERRITIRK